MLTKSGTNICTEAEYEAIRKKDRIDRRNSVSVTQSNSTVEACNCCSLATYDDYDGTPFYSLYIPHFKITLCSDCLKHVRDQIDMFLAEEARGSRNDKK